MCFIKWPSLFLSLSFLEYFVSLRATAIRSAIRFQDAETQWSITRRITLIFSEKSLVVTFWRQFVDLSFQFELYQKMFNVILDSNSLRVRHLAISTIRTCARIVLLFRSKFNHSIFISFSGCPCLYLWRIVWSSQPTTLDGLVTTFMSLVPNFSFS